MQQEKRPHEGAAQLDRSFSAETVRNSKRNALLSQINPQDTGLRDSMTAIKTTSEITFEG